LHWGLRTVIRTLPLLGFIAAMSACIVVGVAPTPLGSVSFVVIVNPGLFPVNTVLSVDVWNAAQLAALDENARCAGGRGPGPALMQCPPGVTYRDVIPERVQIPLSSSMTSFELTPSQVGAGEKFRIHVSGPGRDRCHTSSADLVRTADRGRTLVDGLPWQTTPNGCIG
jgi:hypothetical protein